MFLLFSLWGYRLVPLDLGHFKGSEAWIWAIFSEGGGGSGVGFGPFWGSEVWISSVRGPKPGFVAFWRSLAWILAISEVLGMDCSHFGDPRSGFWPLVKGCWLISGPLWEI